MIRLILALTVGLATLHTSNAQIFRKRVVCNGGKCCTPQVVHRPQVYQQNPTGMVRVQVGRTSVVVPRAALAECQDERAAWETADQNLTTSVVARTASSNAVDQAKADADAARAALAAAEAVEADAVAQYEAASAAVVVASQAASQAYTAFLDCVTQ